MIGVPITEEPFRLVGAANEGTESAMQQQEAVEQQSPKELLTCPRPHVTLKRIKMTSGLVIATFVMSGWAEIAPEPFGQEANTIN